MRGFPAVRPRRLRTSPALRRLVAETTLQPGQLVLPMFVARGRHRAGADRSMPGVVQHTRDSLRKAAAEAVAAGVGGVMLFGIPARKDAAGSGAIDPDGILNVAIRDVVAEVGDALAGDGATCAWTSSPTTATAACSTRTAAVDNDATLERYAQMALAQAAAGRPRGRAQRDDGRPGRRRPPRPGRGRAPDSAILAYSAKYASAFYGPFREAVESVAAAAIGGPTSRTRPTAREALREVAARRRRGRRHRDGQAGARLPRRGRGRSATRSTYRSRRTTSRASTRWSRPPPRTAGSTASARSMRR